MNPKTYFITLTPYQLFFFGGEQGEKADYYLIGSFIPQQTALLGLIRHQILLQNNLMLNNKIINDDDAIEWIGAKSFEYDKENDFNKILSISPCYLVKDGGVQKKYLPHYPAFVDGIIKLGDHFFLPNYDPKEHYSATWKEVNGNSFLKETDCYEEVERIGVDKNYSGKTENDSFFKQIWLKMKNGYSFGFYITISDDVVLNNADVAFGKESSAFMMQVSDIPMEPLSNVNNPNAILLISDAFVSPDFLNSSGFAICDTVPFRNLVNPTSMNHNYYGRHKSPVRLQLLKKGSVFLAERENLAKMQNDLNTVSNFIKIGYNQFQLIKIEY
jgi:CRISPR type III-B/RAMP module-associated protein Cmr3